LLKTFSILLVSLVFYSPENKKSNEWETKINELDYQVLVRESDISDIKEIKIVHKFKGNFKKLVLALNNIETNKKLFNSCTEARLLKQLDAHSSYQYFYFKMPLTISDRDIISKVTIHSTDTTYSLVSSAADSKIASFKSKVIRITQANTSWQFKKTRSGDIHMEYYASADPKGKIPKWLVNAFAIREARISIDKLKKMIQ
jgi:hypothetical protein